jgi:hypothetical protein
MKPLVGLKVVQLKKLSFSVPFKIVTLCHFDEGEITKNISKLRNKELKTQNLRTKT